MSLKNERDSSIQNIFVRHNLGSLPKFPFSDEIALNFTNRIKSRLMDLEKDLQDKKVTFMFGPNFQLLFTFAKNKKLKFIVFLLVIL